MCIRYQLLMPKTLLFLASFGGLQQFSSNLSSKCFSLVDIFIYLILTLTIASCPVKFPVHLDKIHTHLTTASVYSILVFKMFYWNFNPEFVYLVIIHYLILNMISCILPLIDFLITTSNKFCILFYDGFLLYF